MNRIIIILILVVFPPFVFSQTQQGIVKTRGRMVNGQHVPGTGLSGATVTVKGGNAVVSSNTGTFVDNVEIPPRERRIIESGTLFTIGATSIILKTPEEQE